MDLVWHHLVDGQGKITMVVEAGEETGVKADAWEMTNLNKINLNLSSSIHSVWHVVGCIQLNIYICHYNVILAKKRPFSSLS